MRIHHAIQSKVKQVFLQFWFFFTCIFISLLFFSYVHACSFDNATYTKAKFNVVEASHIYGNVDKINIKISYFPLTDYRQQADLTLVLKCNNQQTCELLNMLGLPPVMTFSDISQGKYANVQLYNNSLTIDITDGNNIYIDLTYKIVANITTYFFIFKEKPLSLTEYFALVNSSKLKHYTEKTDIIDYNDLMYFKARQFVEESNNIYEAIFKIASYVDKIIDYDVSYGDVMLRASEVFQQGRGTCDEFSILFIALCRSVGIPARYVTGVAYSNLLHDFVEHAWVEVFMGIYNGREVWLPVDITFNQIGWIDTSHIAMSKVNPQLSTAEYSYVGSINVDNLHTDVNTIYCGNVVSPLTGIDVKPLYEHVKMGSYLPVRIIVHNLQPYYVVMPIYLVVSPSEVEENKKLLFLKPFSSSQSYFVVPIPELAKCSVGCKSNLKFATGLNAYATSEITFSSIGPYISEEEANSYLNVQPVEIACVFTSNISDVENQQAVSSINSDKFFYTYETVYVNCIASATETELYKVCFSNDCIYLTLSPTPKKFDFTYKLEPLSYTSEHTACITVTKPQSSDVVARFCNTFTVLPAPKIELINTTKNVYYSLRYPIVLTFYANQPLDADISIYKDNKLLGKSRMLFKEGENIVSVDAIVHNLHFGNNIVKIVVTATDMKGNKHEFDYSTNIFVNSVTLWRKLLIKLKALFLVGV